MKHLVNDQVKKLEIPGIRKISNMLVDYPDAINLTLGQPDFITPEHIKASAKNAIDRNRTSYTHNAGLLELRQAASEYFHYKYGLTYDSDAEILITNGASEALDITFRTILEKGSEVLLPVPIYPGYEPLISLCGAIPVYIDTSFNDFKLNAELIEKHITNRTKCIVLPYPSNPIGTVLLEEELSGIAELLKDKEIFIVSDEIYSEHTYSGRHFSIAAYPSMRDKTIVINGLSKSHAMTGWRIGFTFAPKYLTEEMLKVHLYNSVCACTISQYAALEALTKGQDDALIMKREYQKRRDYVFNRLISMGLDVLKPEGAFYLFPSILEYRMNSYEFSKRLLEEAGVAVVPGSAFTKAGEGYIRISYAYSLEHLETGLDRLEKFIKNIKEVRVSNV
ncbi:aminotransferase [Neobacillus niacini]|uniref:aminotransferase A n=1 Tax=Neobacillus driksii TaxID=3035913 RepID=UPI00277E0ABB|nr:aminotransferase A [Neobacillus niacini]MDQ0970311.1 aminotransferase [Neobacillus niacini]